MIQIHRSADLRTRSRRRPFLLLMAACLLTGLSGAAPTASYDVKDFGAAGDGETLDTAAIQKAIDKAAEAGGGQVVLAGGTFLSGTFYLKSGTTLVLEKDAVLLATQDVSQYPAIRPGFRSYSDNYSDKSLIYAEDQQDIAIIGEGKIDGQGDEKPFLNGPWKGRPHLFKFVTCQQVTVKGVELIDPPFWAQHYLACDDVLIDGITVDSRRHWVADGLDIDSCHRVRIVNCTIQTRDDSIALKTTSPRATKDVHIENCRLSATANAIKTGTESTGNFENITVKNVTITDTQIAGIALLAVDGGVMQNVQISNITMENVKSPMFLRLGNRARDYLSTKKGIHRTGKGAAPTEKTKGDRLGVGSMRDIVIRNVTATGAGIVPQNRRLGVDGASPISGIEGHPIENLRLENIAIAYVGHEEPLIPGESVPEKVRHYPEQNMFGILPAYGFYIRHAKDVRMSNIDLSFDRQEPRPAIALDDVHGFYLENAMIDLAGADTELVRQQGSTDVQTRNVVERRR